MHNEMVTAEFAMLLSLLVAVFASRVRDWYLLQSQTSGRASLFFSLSMGGAGSNGSPKPSSRERLTELEWVVIRNFVRAYFILWGVDDPTAAALQQMDALFKERWVTTGGHDRLWAAVQIAEAHMHQLSIHYPSNDPDSE